MEDEQKDKNKLKIESCTAEKIILVCYVIFLITTAHLEIYYRFLV